MYRKTATISLALLSLTLTVTLSSAQSGCPGKTVPEVLQSYDLPPGFFPDFVHHFECTRISGIGVLVDKITITFRGDNCKVSRQVSGVENVVECGRVVSAIISFRRLSDIKAVTVKLTAREPPYGPFELRLNVTEVNVYQFGYYPKFVQFTSYEGVRSPPFPVTLFPPQPPKCDSAVTFQYSYEDALAAFAAKAKDKDNQDVDVPVSKRVYQEFGRLLPLVAA